MILGVSVLENRVLLASFQTEGKGSTFVEIALPDKTTVDNATSGFIWNDAGDAAKELCAGADRIAVAIPSSKCYLKRIKIPGKAGELDSSYLEWLAGIQLPGELTRYAYGYVPIRRAYDDSAVEMVFHASPADFEKEMIHLLKNSADAREVTFVPDQLGLVNILEKSIAKEDIPQAAIVNCECHGAVVVTVRDGCYDHSRYFQLDEAHQDDFSADIETYLLSRADVADSFPLVVAGRPGVFKTGWEPVIPSFLSIHDLEYSSAWGCAAYLMSTKE